MSSIRSVGNVYVDSFETILVNAKNNIYTNYIKKNGLQVLINTIRDTLISNIWEILKILR